MDIPVLRTWVIFYLISFVVLLFALFLTSQGVLLWISLFLVLVLIGVNFFTIFIEIKRRGQRHTRLKNIAQVDDPEYNLNQKKLW
ncbi:signal transduction histidine kinase [Methanocalculus alkaliphilus]|uniref:hypothetical protein n=1 Tax=Methanocalculus alkaliphilus TaxID=768730 RepID=UPI0020A0211D|nr:hypothetical protein [Methanocalculus alkaliphilus]MCP1714592.1 signal transduction histidine kinase [Methanocalculus alkaliphilus]